MSHDGCLALPHGTMGLSAVCYCGISWSYSLTIFHALFLIRAKISQISCYTGVVPKQSIDSMMSIAYKWPDRNTFTKASSFSN